MLTLNSKFIIVLFFLASVSFAQEYEENQLQDVYPMSIPSSPAFSLLGVNPELVTRPSDIKEFKVDWRIKNYKLAPDLAIEAQPVWFLYTRNLSPMKYRELDPVAKVLSSLSLSLATAKIDNVNHMTWAAKLNLYKEKDPFDNRDFMENSQYELSDYLAPYHGQLDSLRSMKSRTIDVERIKSIESEEREVLRQIKHAKRDFMEQIRDDSKYFAKENWNMDMVDMAFGKVHTYNNGALDSLRFRNAGFGVWVNGAKGIGQKSLVTGMVKLSRVGINNNFFAGLSYRYGSEKFNFFTELVFQKINNNPANGFLEDEYFGDQRELDLGSAWFGFEEGEGYSMYTMSYGGDFKLNSNILLNFSLRTELTEKLKFSSFLPMANIICLMNFDNNY